MNNAHKKMKEYGFNRFAKDFKVSTASLYKWIADPYSMTAGTLLKFREFGIEWYDFTEKTELIKEVEYSLKELIEIKDIILAEVDRLQGENNE